MAKGHNRPCGGGTPPKEKRLSSAAKWIKKYDGQHIVKAYKKRYGVDQFTAMRELQELGVPLDPGYIERASQTEQRRIELLPQKRVEKAARMEKSAAAYKNHIYQDGKLLQTNKRWSGLKERQRTEILEAARQAYIRYIRQYGKQPRKDKKDIVCGEVEAYLKERDIWLPYGELKTHVFKYIDRLNRRMLYTEDENGTPVLARNTKESS